MNETDALDIEITEQPDEETLSGPQKEEKPMSQTEALETANQPDEAALTASPEIEPGHDIEAPEIATKEPLAEATLTTSPEIEANEAEYPGFLHEDEVASTQPQEEASQEEKEGLFPSSWLLLLVGLLVGGLGGFYLRPVVTPEAEATAAPLAAVEDSGQINKPNPHQSVMLAVIAGARHFYGDPNAPVTVVEFGDFNCGYCGRWAHEVLPRIDENYIKTGKVRMAYIHFPILGADSMTAAEATECAAEQDSFWAYHNLLFSHQGIGFTQNNLISLAGQLDLDTAAFEECLVNFSDRASLEDDIRLGQVMGVRGTPAFLVNGVPLAGAYPYEHFEQVIERSLAGEF